MINVSWQNSGRIFTLALVSILAVGLLVACGSPEPEAEEEMQQTEETQEAEQEEMEVVQQDVGSAFVRDSIEGYGMDAFMEIVETEHSDRFDLEYAGGPEAFPPFEVFANVQEGAIDIANVTGVFYSGAVPIAQGTVFPDMTPWEMRQNGIYDFFDEVHQRNGVKYLGRHSANQFACYLQEPIEEPEDLEGRDIRTTPVYRPMLEHFGANTVTTPPGEIYTALERGVVEGFCWPEAGIVNYGWHEQVDYVVKPGFFQVEVSLLMNLDEWEALSDEHQEALMDAVKTAERQSYFWNRWQAARDEVVYREVGLETIQLEGDAADRYVNAAYNSYWEMLEEGEASQEDVDRLRTLLQEAGSDIPMGWDE